MALNLTRIFKAAATTSRGEVTSEWIPDTVFVVFEQDIQIIDATEDYALAVTIGLRRIDVESSCYDQQEFEAEVRRRIINGTPIVGFVYIASPQIDFRLYEGSVHTVIALDDYASAKTKPGIYDIATYHINSVRLDFTRGEV